MTLKAYAKVNLYLDITGRRPDGYHELVTLMCPIGLFDVIRMTVTGSPEITVTCDHPHVPGGERNIAHIAASRFFQAAGIGADGIDIHIEKQIPVGAGLGGGSSNAAAVLTELNARYGAPLSSEVLSEIGLSVGADVPFFLYGRPAIATGIGEFLTPFPHLPPHPLVIIHPGHLLSTREVYKNFKLGLTKKEKIHTKNIFKLDWGTNLSGLLFNALETSACELSPQIVEAKNALLNSGAVNALMSGSGSSVFGVYNDPQTAAEASASLSRKHEWSVFLTRLLV